MAKQQYEPYENFHTRLKVETTYPEGKKDHREGFQQAEYFKNCQREPRNTERTGFPEMQNVVRPPKPAKPPVIKPNPKTQTNTDDAALKKAAKKDLTNRGL